MNEDKKTLNERWIECQQDLPTSIKTDKSVSFGGSVKYTYLSCKKLLEEVQPIMKKKGFSVSFTSDEKMFHAVLNYGFEELKRASVEKPTIEDMIKTNTKMSPAQIVGSITTYMERYTTCALLGIPFDDDDSVEQSGGRVSKTINPHVKPEPKIDRKLETLLRNLYEDAKKRGFAPKEDIKKRFDDIFANGGTEERYNKAIEYFTKEQWVGK